METLYGSLVGERDEFLLNHSNVGIHPSRTDEGPTFYNMMIYNLSFKPNCCVLCEHVEVAECWLDTSEVSSAGRHTGTFTSQQHFVSFSSKKTKSTNLSWVEQRQQQQQQQQQRALQPFVTSIRIHAMVSKSIQ